MGDREGLWEERRLRRALEKEAAQATSATDGGEALGGSKEQNGRTKAAGASRGLFFFFFLIFLFIYFLFIYFFFSNIFIGAGDFDFTHAFIPGTYMDYLF